MQGSHASWKILENHFGPGKSWKLMLVCRTDNEGDFLSSDFVLRYHVWLRRVYVAVGRILATLNWTTSRMRRSWPCTVFICTMQRYHPQNTTPFSFHFRGAQKHPQRRKVCHGKPREGGPKNSEVRGIKFSRCLCLKCFKTHPPASSIPKFSRGEPLYPLKRGREGRRKKEGRSCVMAVRGDGLPCFV